MSAKFYLTKGLGLETRTVKAGNFTELKAKVEQAKEILSKHNIIIEKIIYTYPSGKTFIER